MALQSLAGNLFIPGPAGQLEAVYTPADAGAAGSTRAAVVCHAHPLHGGTMHFRLIVRIARALGECGMPTLRFNYRGVGGSEGSFDEGRGERDDVKAAVDWLGE